LVVSAVAFEQVTSPIPFEDIVAAVTANIIAACSASQDVITRTTNNR
jgi:hypothetical protein